MESFRENSAEDDVPESNGQDSDSDHVRLAEESTRMMHAIEIRDKIIEKMESKIKTMAEEMLSSTRLMNKLSAEREDEQLLDSKRTRQCCKTIEQSLKASTNRCRELSDLLEKSEQDNVTKSKQAAQALAALDAYQRGDDGLSKALRKITSLEQKLSAREKHIRALVMELNSMHEISSENTLLRKKLNIPDDVMITSRNLVAKERSKDKQIERLTLKLRASEEMRLQLKLEKSDLRKQLLEHQNVIRNVESSSDEDATKNTEKSQKKSRPEIYCDNCLKNIQTLPNKDSVMQDVIQEWENKYSDVVEENENLRVGMHEILEKIREYDATSEHITIDCEILERIVHALDARSISGWYHPAMRIQNELIALRERELALREKINSVAMKELPQSSPQNSIDEVREAGEIPDSPAPSLPANPFDSSTRPTTPNKALDQSLYPVIVEADIERESVKNEFLKTLEKNRSLQQEIQRLQVFQVHFEELSSQLAASESDVTKYCSILVEKLSTLEIEFNTKNKAYDFLKEDFDRMLNEYKASEMRNMTLIADLKKQVNDRRQELNFLEVKKEELIKQTSVCNPDEYDEMQRTLYNLQSQVASLIDHVLSGKVADIQMDGICTDYGVIQDNLEIDFITVQEYECLQSENVDLATREKDLKIKCDHLESLLLIAKEQVTSQQKLLTDITDNHIGLRHLVADLQSSNEDKFLIAKIQRELDYAKKEIITFKLEKEQFDQDRVALNNSIEEKEQEFKNATQKYQNQIKNTNLKNKFLQKALQNLRQKYVKFSPLIFLSNFVYAYAKFTKHAREEENKLHERLPKLVDDILLSKIDTIVGAEHTESQDRIKWIKTESKAKYLEDQVQAMNQKNLALQIEIDELHLAVANESEHWKTIAALFGPDHTPKEVVERGVQTDSFEMIDSTTITEDEPETQEQTKILPKVDKSVSPLASPTRKDTEKTVFSSETQTSSIDTASKQTSPIATPVKQSEIVKPVTSQSQGVQTSPKHHEGVAQSKPTVVHSVQTSPLGSPKLPKHNKDPPEQVENDSKFQQLIEEDCKLPEHTEFNAKLEDLKNQLTQALAASEDRKERLEKAEDELQTAKKSIEEMDQKLQEKHKEIQRQKSADTEEKTKYQAGIIEKTILSFHTLLSEKDKSIHQYQELLLSERNENEAICIKYDKQIEHLGNTISDLNANIKAKDEEILELKTKLEANKRANNEKVDIASGVDDNGDNSLQEISDEKIEEMFNDEGGVSEVSEKKSPEILYARDSKNKEKYWENILRVKDEEISLLKEKLQLYQEREKVDSGMNPEMEQLRILLEEKDKHINDLMDTLTNFHDDQQRFLNDSSNYSADQISKLAANLTRSEATTKIYQAQLEALRRQLANLNQREKQARDLNNQLRNQLIKRPVVSIKTELNARLKTENLQKKIHQLEADLEEAQHQIKRQQTVIDAKRAKSANEVGLWEKQKRWQQSAEKFKAKLEETEAVLEKHKALLHSARTTISRMEKDKQILESKIGKGSSAMKCCRTPSCPNLQGTKYTPSETPETYTGDSECSSPTRGMHFLGSNHNELIEALKARIELQQRKIIAMEMEGKGTNALTTELEKMQERYSAIEAQNIRLEARNLQLQLDNDLLRQGDSGERMQKRVKHLEDYIIALKEELAEAAARRQLNPDHKQEKKYAPGQAEQTILSLRSIIEKLRVENKYLKDGRKSCDSRADQDTPTELKRLQHMYTESLDKISALQIELQLKARCQNCGNKGHLETFTCDDVRLIKEQLLKKTQLLEKAKILLTRAAAKEKVLKEQLSLWKRKCSELQNVPVIEEISE